jgi:ribulose-5-phosphate 4-epimerase/fuculose-1-phosphate aldolase
MDIDYTNPLDYLSLEINTRDTQIDPYPSQEEWEIVRTCGQQMDEISASRCWKNHGFFAYSY